MSNVRQLVNLTEAEVFYIIDTLARTKSPAWTKQKFDKFFTPRTVDSNLLIELAAQFSDRIKSIRERYENTYDDIPIASNRCQLMMLQELYEFCCEEREVGVGAGGNPIIKADYPTARKCVETANQIAEREKIRKLRESEMERRPATIDMKADEDSDGTVTPRFTMKIVTAEDGDD